MSHVEFHSDLGEVQHWVRTAVAGEFDKSECPGMMKTLREYECWIPYEKVLRSLTKETDSEQRFFYYLELIRFYCLHMVDIDLAANVAREYLAVRPLSFEEFRREVISRIELSDRAQVEFIDGVLPSFSKEEQVSSLEFVSFLLEKKLHDERRLLAVFKKLLSLDPSNSKALRFFKDFHAQHEEWELVADYLTRLCGAVEHKSEKYRYAHELAGVSLYNLDSPAKCLEVLKQRCSDSPLDSSTLLFEAYRRSEDWQGCMSVLDRSMPTGNPSQDAARHYRIAQYASKIGDLEKAKNSLVLARNLSSEFWEPVEELVHIAILQKDWQSLLTLTWEVSEKTSSEQLSARVLSLHEQLQHGLNYASHRSFD